MVASRSRWTGFFVWKCGAMLRRPRTRSAAAMLAGRRCVRRQAVAARRSVGDGDRKLMVAPGNPGQASGSRRHWMALRLTSWPGSGAGQW